MFKYLKGFMPLFLFMSLFACKKETNSIGINLRDDGGAIGDTTEWISDIICRTISEDSLRTDTLSSNILGATNDPLFGVSRANLICQPRMTEFGYDFTGASIDSIVLVLKYERSQFVDNQERLLTYGNLSTEMKINVFKVEDELIPASKYYSNSVFNIGNQIGSYTGKFNFYDSVEVISGGDTFMTAPELRIKLDNSFGAELLSEPTGTFANQEAFLNYLKGIILIPETSLGINEGAFVGIDYNNARNALKVHYNSGESKTFAFTGSSEHIGIYEIISQPSSITDQKTGSGHYNTGYVQSMAGSKLKIEIPGLMQLIERSENLVIAEAKITIPLVAGSVTSIYGAPHRMLLFRPNLTTGENQVIIDFIDDIAPPRSWSGLTNYGGRYESNINGYEFHFTRFLQELIQEYNEKGINNFNGFYLLMPSDFPITPSRAAINTNLINGIQVSISYSKLN